MNEYDIAIRETLEMTVTVEAENREEARRMVEERWKTANISWTRTASRTWNFTPEAAAATGASDELFFGRLGFPCGEWNVYVPASIAFVIPQRQLVRGNAP